MPAALWKNRPSVLELMFFAIAVLVTHWLIGMPIILLAAAALLILVGGTVRMARADLRNAADVSDTPPAGEAGDASN
jgi:hypothetical protein